MTPPTATATVAILGLVALGLIYAVVGCCRLVRLVGDLSRH